MTKYTFKQKDFKAFDVDGLDARMEALEAHVRPQLRALGDYFADYFTSQTGETFYSHVAKHARRRINVVIKCCLIFKLGYLKTICLSCMALCTKLKIKPNVLRHLINASIR